MTSSEFMMINGALFLWVIPRPPPLITRIAPARIGRDVKLVRRAISLSHPTKGGAALLDRVESAISAHIRAVVRAPRSGAGVGSGPRQGSDRKCSEKSLLHESLLGAG